jgi:hypothetical protein
MKYPLAIVNKLLSVYGSDILAGYDIGCAFSKTIEHSSLGNTAKENRFNCTIPSCHGYGHNRGCQLHWHPLYTEGAGKEDFEGSERVFSESNALAAATRLATPFHRTQALEEHWKFWSMDKHAASGM